ncbi:YciI family protein [Paraburkholderia haematera]|jgi:Uncharacterized protein conserved in bacteria|uniref:YCII-related domain-containing protein n=1 Tax=Paraburkholderia haematera TaxID=2793077 RepID=A0ABN7MNN4_9BURK|nr:YciI family protein [Paraburkholderia haematera]CAE6809379.1 hypothetical protein R69888_05588 [Paraburkholderia haematera]
MLYILYCKDNPRVSVHVRTMHKEAHLAYLADHAGLIVLGGAMLDEDGETRVGSTLILNVGSRAEAEAFSVNEPFRRAGLYASVDIIRMRRAQWRPELAPQSVDGK